MVGIRVGLVGAGGIAPAHIQAWQALGATVTVHSRTPPVELAQHYGLGFASSIDQLLASASIVDIISPTATHHGYAMAAIAAGKHVVCEKPLAATTSEAIELHDAAARAGVQLLPAHVVRYFPEYVAIKGSVMGGAVGDIATIRLSRAGQAPGRSWFFDDTAGAGLISDQMIHDLDQARWLAGEVAEVYAVQNPPSVHGRTPPIATATVVLTHRSGAISHAQGHWGTAGLAFRTRIRVVGSAGTLHYRSATDDAMMLDLPGVTTDADYLPPATHRISPFEHQLREFAAACTGGPPARVSSWDGVVAVALAEAAKRSVATGQAVPFDESELSGAAGP